MAACRDFEGAAGLADLRARLRAIERLDGVAGGQGPAAGDAPGVAGLGDRRLDQALPWGGLPRGGLHEVAGARDGAATGFALALSARLLVGLSPDRRVVWCQTACEAHESGLPYGPGLAALGLDWRRLLVVRARRQIDLLWAMEEALRCPGVGVVFAEAGAVDLRASRRLQLAAESTGTTALLVRMGDEAALPSAALTRWRVGMLAAAEARPVGIGNSRWAAELWRCRGGRPQHWTVEWDEQALRFVVATPLADRPVEPTLAAVSA